MTAWNPGESIWRFRMRPMIRKLVRKPKIRVPVEMGPRAVPNPNLLPPTSGDIDEK